MVASIDGAEFMKKMTMAANGWNMMERNDCKLLQEANGDQGRLNCYGSDDSAFSFLGFDFGFWSLFPWRADRQS
jgi:hypothetical protein